MVPLFVARLLARLGDSRVMPRIYQQIDWSNGGDGIVVRENIRSACRPARQEIVMAQNSPSQYFALNMLVAGGVQPSEVKMKYTAPPSRPPGPSMKNKDIAGAVSWSPDIYNLAKVKGNRMLVTHADGQQADRRHLVRPGRLRQGPSRHHRGPGAGDLRRHERLKQDEAKHACAELMAEGYGIPADDALKMLDDAHNTNWAENYQFFLNQNNPTNFEHVWQQAYYLYRQIHTIEGQPVPFDQVMDFSVIAKLGKEPKYASQKDEYEVKFVPKGVQQIKAESEEILTNTVVIHFFPIAGTSARPSPARSTANRSSSSTIRRWTWCWTTSPGSRSSSARPG